MKNIIEDKIFSKNLLELSSLKISKIVNDSYCAKIIRAHGGLVELSNENILFDLRSYSHKPVFGHNHPLEIRFKDELIKNLKENEIESNDLLNESNNYLNRFFKNADSLISRDLPQDFYLNFFIDDIEYIVSNKFLESDVFKLFQNYLDVVLIKGQRLQTIQNLIKEKLKHTNIVLVGNLLFLNNSKGLRKEDLVKYNIFTNDENFVEEKIVLYIPISITNDQLEFLLSKIKVIHEAL